MTWSLWGARNEKVWENKRKEPENIVVFVVQDCLSQWEEVQIIMSGTACKQKAQEVTTWACPPPRLVKCNADATFLIEERRIWEWGGA